MSFYKETSGFIQYLKSIRKLEDYISFDLKFPSKWNLPKNLTDNNIVPFDTEEENQSGFSFVCKIDEKDISEKIKKIGLVIKLNLEKEMKEKLFRQKVEQLKSLFEKSDLDNLKNLYFDFEKKKDLNNGEQSENFELA